MGAKGERGRGLLDISYTDQKAVNTADRKESEFPVFGSTLGTSSGHGAASSSLTRWSAISST